MDNYYIYIYLNPEKSDKFVYSNLEFKLEPFYVGKGRNNRAKIHLSSCWNKKDKKKYRLIFYRKLRKLLKRGVSPEILIYKENLSEIDALNLETELVEIIGRRITKEGPLCNISKGGEGASGTIAPRFKISIYDNNGTRIEILNSTKECSKKYKISEMTVYKHCLGIRKLPINNLRFRKYDKNSPNIEKAQLIQNRKTKHFKISSLSKPILIENIITGEIVEFSNAKTAAYKLNVSEGLIRDRVIGKTKRYSKLKEYKIKYK